MIRIATAGALGAALLLISAPLGSAESISGKIIVPQGMSAEGICVSARVNGSPVTVLTGAGGTYKIPVVPGTYFLRIQDEPSADVPSPACVSSGSGRGSLLLHRKHIRRTFVDVGVGENVTGVDWEMERAGSITGVVQVPAGFNREGVCLFRWITTPDEAPAAVTDASGRFTISGLYAGELRLQAGGHDNFFCSGQQSLGPEFLTITVREGQVTSGVVFAFGTGPSSAGESAASPSGGPSKATALKVSAPVVSATAIAQRITAPAAGIAKQVGTFTPSTRAGTSVRACSGQVRVRSAGNVRVTCRLTAEAKAARKTAAIRVTLVTTLVAKGKQYRATRTIVLPRSA